LLKVRITHHLWLQDLLADDTKGHFRTLGWQWVVFVREKAFTFAKLPLRKKKKVEREPCEIDYG
jgi:hypothetical protein